MTNQKDVNNFLDKHNGDDLILSASAFHEQFGRALTQSDILQWEQKEKIKDLIDWFTSKRLDSIGLKVEGLCSK